jgi:hypothetical protein
MLTVLAFLLGYATLTIFTLMIWPAAELFIKGTITDVDKTFYWCMSIFWPLGLPLVIIFVMSEVVEKFPLYDKWINALKAHHQAKTAPKLLPPPLPTMETVDGYDARIDQFPMPTADFRSMNCHSCGHLIK